MAIFISVHIFDRNFMYPDFVHGFKKCANVFIIFKNFMIGISLKNLTKLLAYFIGVCMLYASKIKSFNHYNSFKNFGDFECTYFKI